MKPGLYTGVSFADYHAIDAASSSALREIRAGCPAMVPWKRAHPEEDTDATIVGTAAHMMLLQPDLFDSTYAFKPDGMSFATKEGKAWRDDPVRAGKKVISAGQSALVRGVVEAVEGHAVACAAVRNAHAAEATVVWIDSDTGLLCKGRPDFYDDGFIYDFKTTVKADPARFAYAAFLMGWFHQLAWYRTGMEAGGFGARGGRILAVHSQPPHSFRVNCAEVKDATLDVCAMENEAALRVYRECKESGEWPGYPKEWKKVEMPAGALAQIVGTADFMAENEEV